MSYLNRPRDKWGQARNLQEKMRKTAHQIKSRLEALELELRSSFQRNPEQQCRGEADSARTRTAVNGGERNVHSNRPEQPPPYTMDPATNGWGEAEARELSLNMSLERDLNELGDPPSYEQTMEDAYEIYSIDEGVQVYFISSAGLVSAPSTPSSLKIYKFLDEERVQQTGQPPAFLLVGEWLYPLVPGQSPALRSTDGAYIFPDCESTDQGACVGVIVPPDLSSAKLRNFQETIQELTALRDQSSASSREAGRTRSERMVVEEKESESPEQEQAISTTIAKGIETGASWLSWGLGKGATAGSHLIYKGADKLRRHIRPVDDPKEFDEKYQKGVHYARKVTGGVVTVSGVVINGLCYMTTKLGEVAAPVIREQADKLIKRGDGEQENGKWSKAINGAAEVAVSGISGFGVVYIGLESAAKILGKSIHTSTVQVVRHRYGDPAATLTDNSMATVGNVGVTVYNLKHLGVKAIAKRTVKDTGKALAKEYQEKPEGDDTDLNPS